MKKISLSITSIKSLQFIGEKILEQKLRPSGYVEAYLSNDSKLIVMVRYPDYQPTDAVEIGTVHAVVPLQKLYKAAGRGRFLKWLLGGPETLIYEKLNEHYPIEMIGELLSKINIGRSHIG